MKVHLKPFVFSAITILMVACSSANESNKPNVEAQLSAQEQKQLDAWNELSPAAKKILGNYHGLVRNITWEQTITTIQEPLEKAENQPNNGVSFTQYLDETDLNFVDITYKGKEDALSDIILDVFLEDSQEVQALKNELLTFLSIKFGKSQIAGKRITWNYGKTRINLEDVSTSKDPGLQLHFEKLP